MKGSKPPTLNQPQPDGSSATAREHLAALSAARAITRIGWLLMLLLLLPVAVHAQDFTYTVNNGSVTITGYTGTGGAVDIPDTIEGLPVAVIGSHAFFGKTFLTSVTIPNTVSRIESHAFMSCNNLVKVTIPDGVASIGNNTFDSCRSLTSVAIPDSVTAIGSSAFFNCIRLTSIAVDAANPNYSSAEGVLFDKMRKTLIVYPMGRTGGYTIPDGVTTIEQQAFVLCGSLTSLMIPDSVTSIGNSAFASCLRLPSVTIGNGVTNIGDYAFYNCTALTGVAIPDSVTSIGNFTFKDCSSLANVPIGNGLKTVGNSAFGGCGSLVSVTFPESITTIGNFAFSSCPNLKGIYFKGDAPAFGGTSVFAQTTAAIVYYLAGAAGWSEVFVDRPTVLWNPTQQLIGPAIPFGFIINGSEGLVIVVEAATNLFSSNWTPVGTNTVTSGSTYFIDLHGTNHPARYYRLRSP